MNGATFLSVVLLTSGVAAVDRSAPPALGVPRSFSLPAPVSFKLDNGLFVLFLERARAPVVDIVATVEAGMAADPDALPGTSSWTSAMLLEGAGGHDALGFADAQADLGASIHTSTGPDVATVSLHTSAARFEPALALFADALTRPRLDNADWKRVQKNVRAQMRMKAEDPSSLAALAAARAAWGQGHRFSLDVDGTPRSITVATAEDLRAFHEARYRPDTTTLVVVGAIDRKTLTKNLNAAFRHWRAEGEKPARATAPALLPRKTRGVIGVQVDAAPQTIVRVVSATPAPVRPYDAGVEVMNTLLGGSFTSRLNDNLREQHGYAYGASSRVLHTRAGSVFSVRTSVQAGATAFAIDEVLGELARIREPAAQEEVERARNLVALSFPGEFDNAGSISSTWADAQTHGIDAAALKKFIADAAKVDVTVMRLAAERVVDAERCTVIAVGELGPHAQALSRFGPLTMWTAEDLLPGVTGFLTDGE